MRLYVLRCRSTIFDELPPVRPMRDEDPYFSSTRARNSPPDFMPNYQTAPKKSQIIEGRPRRVQAQKSRTVDGQVCRLLTKQYTGILILFVFTHFFLGLFR